MTKTLLSASMLIAMCINNVAFANGEPLLTSVVYANNGQANADATITDTGAYSYLAGLNRHGGNSRVIANTAIKENSTFCSRYTSQTQRENISSYLAFVAEDYDTETGKGKAFAIVKTGNSQFAEIYGSHKTTHRIFGDSDKTAGITNGDLVCFNVAPEKGEINVSLNAGIKWQNIAKGINVPVTFLISNRYISNSVDVSFSPDQSAYFGQTIHLPEGSREGVIANVYSKLDEQFIDSENTVDGSGYVVTNTTTHSARDGVRLDTKVTENTIVTVKLLDVRSAASIVRVGLVDESYNPTNNTGKVYSVLALNKPTLTAFNFDEPLNRFTTKTINDLTGVLPGDSLLLRITVDDPVTEAGEGRFEISDTNGTRWTTVHQQLKGDFYLAATLSTEGDSLFINSSGNQSVDENGSKLANEVVVPVGYKPGISNSLDSISITDAESKSTSIHGL